VGGAAMFLNSKICREKPTLVNLVSFNSKQYNTLLHPCYMPTCKAKSMWCVFTFLLWESKLLSCTTLCTLHVL